MLHKHRILPGYAGGKYIPENVVLLSVSEHAEAHHQLFLKYGHDEDKIAWLGLSGIMSKEEIVVAVLSMAGRHGGTAAAGVSRNCGNKRPDVIARNQLGLLKGQPKTAEHRQKISQAMIGHIVSEEAREKMRSAALSRHRNSGTGRFEQKEVI
jgi:hypothetical protein